MKTKAFIISFLVAVLSIGISSEANAHRWGRPRGHAYGYYRHQPRVWVAPPPRVIVAPRYGYAPRPRYYRAPRYYAHPRYYGYSRPHYRRW